jgi:threonine synthase
MVSLATAHPAKFPEAVEKATGVIAELPPRLGGLFERKERFATLPNKLDLLQDYVRSRSVSH